MIKFCFKPVVHCWSDMRCKSFIYLAWCIGLQTIHVHNYCNMTYNYTVKMYARDVTTGDQHTMRLTSIQKMFSILHKIVKKNMVINICIEVCDRYNCSMLKGHAQIWNHKKSVILFWLLNITIWCKHVHRLELQKFSTFYITVRLDIETKLSYFLFLTWLSIIRNQEFRLYI